MDFDDIWQKYSKDSRIEFARFSFHVGVPFYQLFVFQTIIFGTHNQICRHLNIIH